jgi:hypothetical protein
MSQAMTGPVPFITQDRFNNAPKPAMSMLQRGEDYDVFEWTISEPSVFTASAPAMDVSTERGVDPEIEVSNGDTMPVRARQTGRPIDHIEAKRVSGDGPRLTGAASRGDLSTSIPWGSLVQMRVTGSLARKSIFIAAEANAGSRNVRGDRCR